MYLLFRGYLGRLAEYLGIKNRAVIAYEKIYDKVKLFQMYMLYPIDKIKKNGNKINIMTIEETILYIIKNRCSVSRFGDGEFNLLSDNPIGFQKNESTLVSQLRKVVLAEENTKCLICLPGIFQYEEEYEKSTRKYFLKLLVHKRKEWYSYCNMNYCYGNADITRCYLELLDKSKAEKYFELLKQIWNKQRIVIVEGELTRLGVGNDLFENAKEIYRILCPAINAYSCIEKIEEYIKNNVSKERLILLALGPTATVLAPRLSVLGFQAVDIGNIDKEYEWYKMKSTYKVRNPLKFSMEMTAGTEVIDCTDENYLKQILCRIGC